MILSIALLEKFHFRCWCQVWYPLCAEPHCSSWCLFHWWNLTSLCRLLRLIWWGSGMAALTYVGSFSSSKIRFRQRAPHRWLQLPINSFKVLLQAARNHFSLFWACLKRMDCPWWQRGLQTSFEWATRDLLHCQANWNLHLFLKARRTTMHLLC